MSNKIDTVGSYRGVVLESALGVTKTSGYPQWIARLAGLEKWIEDKEGMEHFGLTEPGWVDWSSYDESILAYLVLFKANVNEGEHCVPGENSFLNYEQLQLATGWDGTEFSSLNDDTIVSRKLLFRVGENEYDGKTRLQVEWVDAFDAPVQRELAKLDADKVKGLNALLSGVKKAATPAKPAGKPSSKPAGKPAGKPAAKPEEKKAPEAPKAPAAAPKAPPKPAPKEEPKEEQAEADTSGLPDAVDQLAAWNFVVEHKGDNEDGTIEDAWLAACSEVGEETPEDQFTDANWAKVRDLVIRDLSLSVS
jgi:hypothetical protein